MTAIPRRLPDKESAELARSSAEELSRLLASMPQVERAHVRLDRSDLILPRDALALLRDLLVEMAQGNAVTIVPTHAELTTQKAANIFNVSRPYLVNLVNLVEDGTIPFSKTGTHRRIRFQDLMSYRERRELESRAALDELISQAQEHDMGY